MPKLPGAWLVIVLSAAAARAQETLEPPLLEPGRPTQAELRLDKAAWTTFIVRVPGDAIAFDVSVRAAEADLDLFVRYDVPMEDYTTDAEHAAATEVYNESLRVSRWDELPLLAGTYYVDAAYMGEGYPRIDGKRASTIPFEITFDVIRPAPPEEALSGGVARGEVSKSNGHACIFEVQVPSDAPCLRLDLAEVHGDLDLLVRPETPALSLDDATHLSMGPQARESLVIDGTSDPPLAAGVYYVTVVDGYQSDGGVPFALHTSLAPNPPQELTAIPASPRAASDLERAILATVELITPVGLGSGTIVTPDGLILTNDHVVEDFDGSPTDRDKLIIALTVDPSLPPEEYFLGRVVHSDPAIDLALVEITSGLYGQPLPADYVFESMVLGDSSQLHLGDPLWVLGFPDIGGTQSRVSVTLTRGIVSGFDAARTGRLIKTDAQFHSGSSGGLAMNERHELIGVPSETVQEAYSDAAGQVGFIRPVSLLPQDWKDEIDRRRAAGLAQAEAAAR